jgi:hypothetical protein
MAYAEASPFEAGAEAHYSIKNEFGGSTVLITGAYEGLIPSLCVQLLLICLSKPTSVLSEALHSSTCAFSRMRFGFCATAEHGMAAALLRVTRVT